MSRTRPRRSRWPCAIALNGTLVEMGSAGAKVAAVVQGLADVYVHAGGQYEWDSAAPVALARAAGLHTSRIDGSALIYNRPDPLLPDLVVCRRELADAVLAVTGGGGVAVGGGGVNPRRPPHAGSRWEMSDAATSDRSV